MKKMNEKEIHTILFWVKSSVADQAYHKMLEATKDMENDIEMSAVVPRLYRVDR